MSKKKGEKKEKAGRKKAPGGAHDLAPALAGAARSMRTVHSRNLLEAGLYSGQDGVILALAEGEALTPGELAHRLGVKAPTMTRTIGRMEAQGFVQRKPDGGDGRQVKVHLTPVGLHSLEKITLATAATNARALQDFSDKEIRTLLKLLKALNRNLVGEVQSEDEEEVVTD
ncbi:MarR family winged helix-turn-helix transcriptional regulator [Rhizobium sp. FKY42]|uniref:MarR family winged helix-turn-helix transcriptional regulator n=1 Tax=Rhizobium sp. FKY42 TaxID=2562310 RepID=UPI0010C002E1|nr:MarR family winged helix-turn-helix transcriptional regulator [Rhizobium sp. FKY42]